MSPYKFFTCGSGQDDGVFFPLSITSVREQFVWPTRTSVYNIIIHPLNVVTPLYLCNAVNFSSVYASTWTQPWHNNCIAKEKMYACSINFDGRGCSKNPTEPVKL